MISASSSSNTGWLYKESQRFTQWWIWVIVVLSTVVFVYLLFSTGVFNNTTRNEPGAETAAALALVAMLITITVFAATRLDLRLNESGVYFRFFPFHRNDRLREWSQVETAYIRTYKPLREYGGWGIRPGFGARGWAYTVEGKNGLQLELKNGKRILIGTQRPEDLQRVLRVLEQMNVLRTTKA